MLEENDDVTSSLKEREFHVFRKPSLLRTEITSRLAGATPIL
ncbi:hypothetical protein HanPI659440_Chr17g0695161 [Helianthus annuus]|nr:hypothetical protein HanPI659440_Chr17g0695161 [Helianthus annuus]